MSKEMIGGIVKEFERKGKWSTMNWPLFCEVRAYEYSVIDGEVFELVKV